MGKSIARAIAVSTLFGLLVALGAHQALAAPTNECLSAPKGVSPKGQHWYYHLDRATQRKCWYLRSTDSGRETAEDLTVDKRKAQAIDSPKSSAHEFGRSADATRSPMPASSAGQTSYANAVPALQMTDLPRPADLSGPAAGAENKQPSTAESPEAPNDQFGSLQRAAELPEALQGTAPPEVPDVDATVAGTTEAQTQSPAAGAATENTTVRQDMPSAAPPVSSTASQGSVAGTTAVVVIAAASVLAALAGFVLLVQRRRRHAMQDVLLRDRATSAPERVATADVLSARTRELLLRCLEEPASSPAKREHAL